MGLKDNHTADGTQVRTYNCDANEPSQKWGYDGGMNGFLRNLKDPTKCLTSSGQSNTPLVLMPCSDNELQIWMVNFDGQGYVVGELIGHPHGMIGVSMGCGGVNDNFAIELQEDISSYSQNCLNQQKWTY